MAGRAEGTPPPHLQPPTSLNGTFSTSPMPQHLASQGPSEPASLENPFEMEEVQATSSAVSIPPSLAVSAQNSTEDFMTLHSYHARRIDKSQRQGSLEHADPLYANVQSSTRVKKPATLYHDSDGAPPQIDELIALKASVEPSSIESVADLKGHIAYLGLVFAVLFTAFNTVQGLLTSLYPEAGR